MDTHECQPLYLEIQEFYEGLNMKVEQQIPLLLVERQALNEAMEGEKNVRLLFRIIHFLRHYTITSRESCYLMPNFHFLFVLIGSSSHARD